MRHVDRSKDKDQVTVTTQTKCLFTGGYMASLLVSSMAIKDIIYLLNHI